MTLEERVADLEQKVKELSGSDSTSGYYTSRHSGEEIDSAVDAVLSGGDTGIGNVSKSYVDNAIQTAIGNAIGGSY